MSLNKAMVIGNLGKDPELRYTPSGTAVCNFSIATTERFKDKQGETQENTTWHNIVVWAGLAEICGKYLHKGKQVYIEGRIQNRSYDGNDGTKRYISEIVASEMKMLGSPDNGAGRNQESQQEQRPRQEQRPVANSQEPPFSPDDDIPF